MLDLLALNETPRDTVITAGQEPLMTKDGVLAFSLYMAGTPFVDDNLWCINYYTAEILRKMGYGGVPMREAAIQAVKAGRPGVIRFLLASPDQQTFTAYREQEQEIQKSEGLAPDVLRSILDRYKTGSLTFGQAAARLCCLLLKMRIQWMNGWKDMIPLLRVDENKAPKETASSDGWRTVEIGGFKLISVNASEKTKQHMGL
jgi:hypothetical protein